MKKILMSLFLLVGSFGLISCGFFEEEPQEFSGSGITITLDESFQETDTMYVPFYLESFDYIFTGEREEKSLFTRTQINSLDDYIEAVLDYSDSNTQEVFESDNGDYLYAYYTATVDGDDFGYMLICMESDQYYYVMNFASFESDFEDSKDQFFEWAETIEVE